MIKILSTAQVREADAVTIKNENISSEELMERAAGACVRWMMSRYAKSKRFIVIAGVGNNGGDALVIARRLLEEGYAVDIYVARHSEKFSADFQLNLDRMVKAGHEVTYVLEEAQFPGIPSEAIIIDGIFGSGLSRPIEGFTAQWIEQINSSIAEVVSIDIPSGLFAEKRTSASHAVIEASHTLAFQVPKLSFLMPSSASMIGEWHVLPIGLDSSYLAQAKSPYYFVDNLDAYAPAFHRMKFDHKGSYGHSLVVAGSHGKMGAAVLSTKATIRSGSGRVTAYVPKCGYEIMQNSAPEAMCSVDEYYEYISEAPETQGYQALGVGPGLGLQKKTRRMLKSLLTQYKKPVVIDADALNMLSESGKAEDWIPANSILTPHPGEFERLFGDSRDDFKRLELLRHSAQKWKVFILLKGAHSALATPSGEVYFNSTGNPGMATGGSGDVLTGLITGLLAQCHDPFTAAVCGMYIHGLAGDLAAETHGLHALNASDIIDHLGDALIQVFETSL